MKFNYDDLRKADSFSDGLASAEWLETNGLGGWAGSTISGAHSRRYHGLLVASVLPPTERVVLLSKLDETIITNGRRIELGSNIYQGNTVHPKGYRYIVLSYTGNHNTILGNVHTLLQVLIYKGPATHPVAYEKYYFQMKPPNEYVIPPC